MAVGCRETPPVAPTNVVARQVAKVPTDPADSAWKSAPQLDAKLIPQDLVEPRLMKSSTEVIHVRALTDGTQVAIRMEWDDSSVDDRPGPALFLDACAIQLPADVVSHER